MIHCISVHKHRGEELDSFIEDAEVLSLYEDRMEEIELGLDKFSRIYFICELEYGYAGVFHNPNIKQLSKLLSKSSTDSFAVSEKLLKLMACSFSDLELDTRRELTDILLEKDTSVPVGIVLSLSNILLQKEGIGLVEMGK